MTWSRRDDQLGWVELNQFLQSDLIISENLNICSFEYEVLIDVPGEGVVVVDHDNILSGGDWWGRGRCPRWHCCKSRWGLSGGFR